MTRLLVLTSTVVVFACLASGAEAQSFRLFLDRLDPNKDGKISRAELPEGATRNTFDRMVEQYKLDAAKTYTREELEKLLSVSDTAGGTNSPSSKSSGSPRRADRRRPGPSASGRGSSSDHRQYRALIELPEIYRKYDKDGDGQVGLYEWPKERVAEFLKLDKNEDGFLVVEELKTPGSGGSSEPQEQKPPASDAASAESGA
jgi:Ca2+-binding EF-hand superfamily protein